MYARHAQRSGAVMVDDNDDVIHIVTERFERRLAEENGKLRVEMATEFGKQRVAMATGFGEVRAEMAAGFGGLRAEMSDRNAEMLKWGLLFGATQTAALAGVIALLR